MFLLEHFGKTTEENIEDIAKVKRMVLARCSRYGNKWTEIEAISTKTRSKIKLFIFSIFEKVMVQCFQR